MSRGDLCCQIVKRGGYITWAEKLGFPRKDSDSDFGWLGEKESAEILVAKGFTVERTKEKRAPYDLLVNDCLRIDVKTACYAEYGHCRGWFYRIAKHSQADVLMLYQQDTKDAYFLPWTVCPTTNVTIARNGGKYVNFRNNYELLLAMIAVRSEAMAAHGAMIIAKAVTP